MISKRSLPMSLKNVLLVLTGFHAALSCVELDLKPESDVSDSSKIAFSVGWDASAGSWRPDTVFIAMNRVSDVIRYAFETDADGKYLPENSHDSSAFYGNYVMLAYTRDRENYDFSGMDAFLSDPKISMKDFSAKIKDLPADELEKLNGGSKIDFNASQRFVRTPDPVWRALLIGDVSSARENLYSFEMLPLLQNLTFSIDVRTGDGVSIASITAEVSGVPAGVSLLTGAVDDGDIARVIFPLSYRNYRYEGTVGVPGLFPSENSRLTTGSGILRLMITAEKDGVRKVLRPAINIGDLITSSSSLMERIPGTESFRMAKSSAELRVVTPLLVDGDSFISGSTEGSVAQWFDSGNIDVEI